MIESGFFEWLLTTPAITALLGQADEEKAAKTYSSVYFSFLPKDPVLPAIVLDRIKSEEAGDTLNRGSAAPGMPIEARFQFRSVANDDMAGSGRKNPLNPSGYLSCCLLSRALREQLKGLATGNAPFPEGTVIQDLWILDEFDAHFEMGGVGYLYCRALQIGIIFVEQT